MFDKPENVFILLILCIPLFAIVGGITVGIVRTLAQQRQFELAQRERIAAIERGLDPSKLPAPPAAGGDPYMSHAWMSPGDRALKQYHGLMIGGILSLAIGIGMTILFRINEQEGHAWAIGILPDMLGLGLLLSAWLVKPRGNGAGPGLPPPR